MMIYQDPTLSVGQQAKNGIGIDVASTNELFSKYFTED
jgi:hypothetical protein